MAVHSDENGSPQSPTLETQKYVFFKSNFKLYYLFDIYSFIIGISRVRFMDFY